MKLTHIRIEQFKQFRGAVEIGALQEGINLFTGPNETGKSTIVAAIRAAFFERFRSGAAEEFRPWNDSSASPSVAIAFEHDGEQYELMKRFLARKRCELRIGGSRSLDGAEAEDELAALMGFQHAGKGASKAEHWGIPGLLWIQQGSGHDVRDAVAHATGHLRTALDASLGEVASSQGDEVIAEVQAARDALLTPSTSKPKGAYATALEKSVELQRVLAGLQAEIAEYRQKVDRLSLLRREHAEDTAEQPWAAFRQQEKAAVEKLRDIQGLQDALALERTQAAQWESRIELYRNRLAAFSAEETAAVARQEAVDRAEAERAAAAALVNPWRARLEQADAALAAARGRLHRARQAETRQQLAREQAAAHARLNAAMQALAQAEAEQGRLIEHQRQAAACRIDEKTMQHVREAHQRLRELDLRQAGVATRLRYRLQDGRHIEVAGQPVRGAGERLLIESTTLGLPGLGEIEIVPGGADLAVLRREQEEWMSRRQDLLQRAGASSMEDAEARQQAYAAHLVEARHAEATLKGLAPRGIEPLKAELAGIQVRIAEIEASLGAASPVDALADRNSTRDPGREPTSLSDQNSTQDTGREPSGLSGQRSAQDVDRESPGLSVQEAETAAAGAESALRQATEGLHAAQMAEGHARVRLEDALRERNAARAALDAEGRAERRMAAEGDLSQAAAAHHAALSRADALERQVAQSRPDILRQDIERYRRSAEQHEKRHNERRDALFRLEAELQVAGAQGFDERYAELLRDLAQAQRQAAELGRQARALDYLLALLRDKRETLTRRLQAPLRRCLLRYVELLFPQAQVEIDEDLMLGSLTRNGHLGAETSAFEMLSFGAREQLGLIARLAYADLLREAGRPTLVILDDALVHSDEERLAQMKRVLFDAGTRHQILLFTCHPERWRDIGVAPRPLIALNAL